MTAVHTGGKSAVGHRIASPAKRAKPAIASKRGKGRNASADRNPGRAQDSRDQFSDDEWHDMVATAAYYCAQVRGFDGTSPDEDWYEAEAELRERFSADDSSVEAVITSGGDTNSIETTSSKPHTSSKP